MHWILTALLITIWLVWAVWYTLFMNEMIDYNLQYMTKPKVNFISTCPPCARYDAIEINKVKIIAFGIFVIPFRLAMIVFFNCCMYVFVLIPKMIFDVNLDNNHIPKGKFYMWLVQYPFHLFMRPCIFFMGFQNIQRKKISIYDVLADYEPQQSLNNPAIAISNHVSFLDMFFYLLKPVSFLSKASVGTTFFIGMFAVARQSLFIKRESAKERNKTLDLIETRAKIVNKGDLPQLLVFPEGTVSNGRVILKFKKGAFCHTKPIKIYAVKYKNGFLSSLSNAEPLAAILLTISKFHNGLEFFEIDEPLDPLWVAKKYNVKPEDPEFWTYVAKEAKSVLTFITGFPSTEHGYRQIKAFEEKNCNMFKNFNFLPLLNKRKAFKPREDKKEK